MKYKDSELMTLDEIIDKLIEAKGKWEPEKLVRISSLHIRKSKKYGINFVIWGDKFGEVI